MRQIKSRKINLKKTFARFVSTGKFKNGLLVFRFEFFKNGRLYDYVEARSGWYQAQTLRKSKYSRGGSREPVPEAAYNLGPVEFAPNGEKWPAIRSEFWISVEPENGVVTGRSFIGIHLDAPPMGTLGCIGIARRDVDKFLRIFQELKPEKLYVDYGLGTVDIPDLATDGTVLPTMIDASGVAWTPTRATIEALDKSLVSRLSFDGEQKKVVITD